MTDPPDRTGPRHAKRTAPATNSRRPLAAEPTSTSRSSESTVTRYDGSQGRDSRHTDVEPPITNIWQFLCWVLSKHSRAAWVLAYVVVILGTFFGVTWLVAPHLGDIVGVLTGLGGAGIGGGAVHLARRRRDQNGQGDQE